MAKLIDQSMEEWLRMNYPDNSNEELTEELNKQLKSKYEDEVRELRLKLEVADRVQEKLKIIERIKRLQSFKGLHPDYVKNYVQRYTCCKKSLRYLSQCNSRNKRLACINMMLKQAEDVTEFYQWFRSFKLNDCKVCHVSSEKNFKSLRSSLCNWNREAGKASGIMLVPEYHKEYLLAKVAATLYV